MGEDKQQLLATWRRMSELTIGNLLEQTEADREIMEFIDKHPRSVALLLEITHGHGFSQEPGVEDQIRKKFIAAINADYKLRDAVLGEFFQDLRRQAEDFMG